MEILRLVQSKGIFVINSHSLRVDGGYLFGVIEVIGRKQGLFVVVCGWVMWLSEGFGAGFGCIC